MDILEVPGCPEGSLRVVAYIKENRPAEITVKTQDEDCIKVLKLVLPLFNYYVVDQWAEGSSHWLKAKLGR
ncbi:hypothetical protein [Pyrobaculum aerophilum]|uniref:Uncharacterized protein n=2 Tax=Pyrobaculum aerophilum TaxID=13773 RepID=Q8ZUE4_PYRAE|nr:MULTISPECIES: hypothetical protein [Pyrobaculum]AAL64463.1 hypothetical protein PAE2825 [Pyrobaculum aerophilum str. IM2]MCX8137324.1 hypothetical protein [Pyrobaculum aerophilum]RFA96141.1 hypothetical protein CGL52_11465 [Pyrobaculum aerophilum]RFA98312.1 hypothetical protein CGL51_01145 [Pyrobaculum aerophilum]HII47317.1 hypothetical protein [Pyrobaculum aerophilum]